MSHSVRPPPPPPQPSRAKGVSRAEARGKVDGERDHEDHAEEAVLYKGFTFAHAKQHVARQTAGQGRPPAKNLPKGSPPTRKKKNSARTQTGDQQDQSSEIEISLGENEEEKRIIALQQLAFASKDDQESDAEGNNNEGARLERRFRQIKSSHIELNKPALSMESLNLNGFGELAFSAANQIRDNAALACTKPSVAKPIQPISQEIVTQSRTLLERGSRLTCEQFSSLSRVRAILVELPPPPKVTDKETFETINLLLPVLLLNAANPRTDEMRYKAIERLAALKRGLKVTSTR
jgi:hypothetical protein